ncbi:dihydrofolate reductase family protein [Microbacterium oryzae]|uniref:Dihydrofolate reductase n=1 Tax=Microbacterium oryzae TaxID=743009 RepID=A0A6I6DYX4_9MICO|nr:dihydrofolate reductase family protein [Microbacterium oryzae]QGU26859.1 dihydrofolate reductase [Microbacterium oryzae]
MLLYSMGVSVDGYISDRHGVFAWSAPSEDLFRFHLERVRGLGATLLGRRLYEAMRVWETDPAMRDSPDAEDFAAVWTALPKVVFSHTLDRVEGNARLAERPLAEEVADLMRSTSKNVEIGGADLAAQAIERDLIDEYRIFRHPVIVGGGPPLLPSLVQPLRLELIETRGFDSGVIYEHYRRAH